MTVLHTYYFRNQGTGPITVYQVDFDDAGYVLVSETGQTWYHYTGWLFPMNYYTGVWDGFWQVTLDPILGASPAPATQALQILGGMFLYDAAQPWSGGAGPPPVAFSTAFLPLSAVTASPTENLTYPKSRLTDREFPYRPCRSMSTAQQDFVFSLGGTVTWPNAQVFLLDANFATAQLATGTSATATDASFNADNTTVTIAQNPDVVRYNLLTAKAISAKSYLRLRIPAQTPTDGQSYFSLGTLGVVSAMTTLVYNVEPYEIEVRALYKGSSNAVIRVSDFFLAFSWHVMDAIADLTAWQQLATYGLDTVFLVDLNYQAGGQDVLLAQNAAPVRLRRHHGNIDVTAQLQEYAWPILG